MTFIELCDRLLGRLRRLLEDGMTTESALARRLGMSPSHLHNTLKGIRGLTLSTADQILTRMDWTVLDLCETEELRTETTRRGRRRKGTPMR